MARMRQQSDGRKLNPPRRLTLPGSMLTKLGKAIEEGNPPSKVTLSPCKQGLKLALKEGLRGTRK